MPARPLNLLFRFNRSWYNSDVSQSPSLFPDPIDYVWTDANTLGLTIEVLVPTFETPEQAAKQILAVLDAYGYDSMDREKAFALTAKHHGWDYDAIYNAWIAL